MDFTPRNFSIADYVIFGIMLAISASIGFFYAIKDRRQKANTKEFLLAGRSMSPYPVALSLAVTFMSAVLILGTPAEMYIYGTMFSWLCIAFLISSVITSEIFIPVYYRLNVGSVYEYLELRFHRVLRILTTIMFMVQTVLIVGVVMYAPALALNAVTGFNIWGAVVSTGAVCILYSALGGLKAVIWSDVFQGIMMVTGMLAVIIQGCVDLGGIENVWRSAEEGGRIIFDDFSFDPRVRHSFWSVVVGGTFLTLTMYATTQSQVQRYMSCRSLADAKKAILLNGFGVVTLNILACLCGVVMFAYYKDCDPLAFGKVERGDQLIPYMVLDIFKNLPGMPGVFIAGVFSGSLSTISTAISALSMVTIQDFIKPWTKWKDSTYAWTSKGLVVFYGGFCMLMAYVTSKLGALLQAAISMQSMLGGPIVGVFSLGIMLPFANTIGAFSGMVVGVGLNVWLFVGAMSNHPPPVFTKPLPLSTDGCPDIYNSTSGFTSTVSMMDTTTTFDATTPLLITESSLSDFYYVSYMYLSVFGYVVTMIVGIIVSLLTGGLKNCRTIDPKLLHPMFDHWLFKCLPRGFKRAMHCGVDYDEMKTSEPDDVGDEKWEDMKIPRPSVNWSSSSSSVEKKEEYINECFTNEEQVTKI